MLARAHAKGFLVLFFKRNADSVRHWSLIYYFTRSQFRQSVTTTVLKRSLPSRTCPSLPRSMFSRSETQVDSATLDQAGTTLPCSWATSARCMGPRWCTLNCRSNATPWGGGDVAVRPSRLLTFAYRRHCRPAWPMAVARAFVTSAG